MRGSDVVVVAPPGEIATISPNATPEFRAAVVQATELAGGPRSDVPQPIAEGDVTEAERALDNIPPVVEGCPAPPSGRGETTTSRSGPAAANGSRRE